MAFRAGSRAMARKAAEVQRVTAGETHPSTAFAPSEADGTNIPRLSIPSVMHLVSAACSDPIRSFLRGSSRQREQVHALVVEARVAVGHVANHQPSPHSPSQPAPRSDRNPSLDQLSRPQPCPTPG